MTPSPVIPRHPLDNEHVVKFALGDALTAALAASGPYHLLVTAPSDATTPEHLQGRRIMLALPITKELADAAYQVATGRARAVRTKHKKP